MTWQTENTLTKLQKCNFGHFLSHPQSLTCRASNRTGSGSKAALPPCPPPSLSDWSSLGWVTSDSHRCSIHGGELSSSAGVRGMLGECVHKLLREGVADWLSGPSLCLQLRVKSWGVCRPALPLLLPSGCRRRSCTSGRGAWFIRRFP